MTTWQTQGMGMRVLEKDALPLFPDMGTVEIKDRVHREPPGPWCQIVRHSSYPRICDRRCRIAIRHGSVDRSMACDLDWVGAVRPSHLSSRRWGLRMMR